MNLLGIAMAVGMIIMSSIGCGVPADIVDTPILQTENKESLAQDPLVGMWHCEKNIFEGLATADIYLIAEKDGSMRALGTVTAPALNCEEFHFSYYLDWMHKRALSYTAIRDGKTLRFQCDGKKLTVSGNPFKLGFTTLNLLDFDTNLEFHKIF